MLVDRSSYIASRTDQSVASLSCGSPLQRRVSFSSAALHDRLPTPMLAGDTATLQMAYPSSSGSHLYFQTDEINSPNTNDSSCMGMPMSPLQEHPVDPRGGGWGCGATLGEFGCCSGAEGNSINRTSTAMKRRPPHPHHSRTASRYSEPTNDEANPGCSQHPPPPISVIARVGTARSLGSLRSASLQFQASFANMQRTDSFGAGAASVAKDQRGLQMTRESSSSAESIEYREPRLARLTNHQSGTYRWDWRGAGLTLSEDY